MKTRFRLLGAGMMIEIVSGNHRDIFDVVDGLRLIDQEEIHCQLGPAGFDQLVALALDQKSWVCRLRGQPVAVFSFSAINLTTVAVNLFGTEQITRAIPAITRFIFVRMIPEALSRGIRRFEARSIVTHFQAHQWLEACGAVNEGLLREYGKNGEDFYMFGLTTSTLNNIKRKRWQTDVYSTSGTHGQKSSG